MKRNGYYKKPRKLYRPRAAEPAGKLRMQPWKLNKLFAPAEEILNRIETGKPFAINEDGDLEHYSAEYGQAYTASLAFTLLAELCAVADVRAPGTCPDTGPLHRFIDKFEQEEMLTQSDIQACRECLAALRRYTAMLTWHTLQDLLHTVCLKAVMDESEDIRQAA